VVGVVADVAHGRLTASRLLLRWVRRNPLGRIAGLFVTASIGIILVNSLLVQEGRHPAPLFPVVEESFATASVPLPVPRPADLAALDMGHARMARVRALQAELARRGLYSGQANGEMSPALEQAIRAFERSQTLPEQGLPSDEVLAALKEAQAREAAARDAAPRPRDAIRELLRQQEGEGRSTLAAQRALNRLGYGPLKEDGQFGPTTRAALERFERDRKLPVRGEASGATLKDLLAAAP
jgi:peptidoglycan hydrolase-like protein with peptidoglycan-binding domain